MTDLSRFRYHTGAQLRPLGEEDCPILFRDLGPVGMARYLSRSLRRLAGPLSPLLYLRTARYVEPYEDHEEIGRLVVIRPRVLNPWHSGVPEVYVADVACGVQADCMAWVPQTWATAQEEHRLQGLPDAAAVREVLGGRLHDERLLDLAHQLEALNAALAESERWAAPVRAQLQSGSAAARQALRQEMNAQGIGEGELCAAWHHLPRQRRMQLMQWLRERA